MEISRIYGIFKKTHVTFLRSKFSLITFNYNNWGRMNQYVLYLTGLSGSGKSTFAKQLTQKNRDVKYVCFDALKFYNDAPVFSKRIVDKFIQVYPEIDQLVKNSWFSKSTIENYYYNLLYQKYCILFSLFIEEVALLERNKYVLEGIQNFVRIPFVYTLGKPVLILTSGSIHNFFNKWKRELKGTSFFRKLIDFYIYQIDQKKLLNHYIDMQIYTNKGGNMHVSEGSRNNFKYC